MKHLRSLTAVAEVARSGSIRRAAERLNITPSALTRQIQDIEYELGTPTFPASAVATWLLPAAKRSSPG